MLKLNERLEVLGRLMDEHFMASAPASLAISLKMLLASGLEEIARIIETGDARARTELVAQLRACKPDVTPLEDCPLGTGERVGVGVWVTSQGDLRHPARNRREEWQERVPVLVAAYRGSPEEPLVGTWQGFLPLGSVVLARFAPSEARRKDVMDTALAALSALGLDPVSYAASPGNRYYWVSTEIYAHPGLVKRPAASRSSLDLVFHSPDGRWSLW